jgi:hypothetical protein
MLAVMFKPPRTYTIHVTCDTCGKRAVAGDGHIQFGPDPEWGTRWDCTDTAACATRQLAGASRG